MNVTEALSLITRHTQLETLLEIARQFPAELPPEKPVAGITRGQFLKVLGIGLLGFTTGRIIDLETKHWRATAHSTRDLMTEAQSHPALLQFGTHPDFYSQVDPWLHADQMKSATDREDKVGYFFSLEDIFITDRLTKLKETCWQVHQRGATPVINLHMWSRPHQLHPFHQENWVWMEQHLSLFLDSIKDLPFPIEIRLFYEMNLPMAFEYGRWRGLSDAKHAHGYRAISRVFATLCTQFSEAPNRRLPVFCPSAIENFGNYIDAATAPQTFPGGLRVDGYDIFPGTILNAIAQQEPALQVLAHALNSLYLVWGKRSPEEVFSSAFGQIKCLAQGKVEFGLGEFGSLTNDARWQAHALLLLAAQGGQVAMDFIVNKDNEDKPYETDWSPTPDELEVVGKTVQWLNHRHTTDPTELVSLLEG